MESNFKCDIIRRGNIYRKLTIKREDFIPLFMNKTVGHNFLHVTPYFKVPVVWGDSYPKTNHMIVAVFSVYAEISFMGIFHQQKVSGIHIVLESVWIDNLTLSEETLSLVRRFVKENSRLKISRNLTHLEKEKIMKVSMEVKANEIDTLENKKWLHFMMPTNVYIPSFGLSLPPDLPFRVFEYLLDATIIKENEDQIFGQQYFYFLDKHTKLIEEKAAKQMFDDFPRYVLDPQLSINDAQTNIVLRSKKTLFWKIIKTKFI